MSLSPEVRERLQELRDEEMPRRYPDRSLVSGSTEVYTCIPVEVLRSVGVDTDEPGDVTHVFYEEEGALVVLFDDDEDAPETQPTAGD